MAIFTKENFIELTDDVKVKDIFDRCKEFPTDRTIESIWAVADNGNLTLQYHGDTVGHAAVLDDGSIFISVIDDSIYGHCTFIMAAPRYFSLYERKLIPLTLD